MITWTLSVGDRIRLGIDVTLIVESIEDGQVSLAFDTPSSVAIYRVDVKSDGSYPTPMDQQLLWDD